MKYLKELDLLDRFLRVTWENSTELGDIVNYYCIKIYQDTEEELAVEVPKDSTLLDAQRLAGLTPDAPCGGRGNCKKCKVLWRAADGVYEEVLACQTKVTSDGEIKLLQSASNHQILTTGTERRIDVEPLAEFDTERALAAAYDVGTTTIAAYLLNARTGEQLTTASKLNPQSEFGADVISRCNYELEHQDGELRRVIVKAMNELLDEMVQKMQAERKDVYGISFAGNTCMHHLFLGLPTEKLVLAPYVAYQTDEMILDAKEYGFEIHPDGILRVLPNIGGFVGADTAACLLQTEFEKRKKKTLMIDIGTNGELVLTDGEKMMSCSTAAGPAFEGAKISCGMRGCEGAIAHVHWENGQPVYEVVGGDKAIGLCGSGLLDLTAGLLEQELLDESGRLEEAPFSMPDGLTLTQKDIRELQLAKAAIGAGIHILCKKMGMEVSDIEEVLIAGAFGNYMNPDSACAIGMIPIELKGRILPIGNAAGEGAKVAILSKKEFENIAAVAKKVTYIDLAFEKGFQDVFVDELEFPENEN